MHGEWPMTWMDIGEMRTTINGQRLGMRAQITSLVIAYGLYEKAIMAENALKLIGRDVLMEKMCASLNALFPDAEVWGNE